MPPVLGIWAPMGLLPSVFAHSDSWGEVGLEGPVESCTLVHKPESYVGRLLALA